MVCVCAWCPWKSEKGIVSPGTLTPVLCKSNKYLLLSQLSSHAFESYKIEIVFEIGSHVEQGVLKLDILWRMTSNS